MPRTRTEIGHLAVVAALGLGGCAKTLDYVELRPEQKLARILKLEDERSLGDGELVTRLGDASARIRRRAALALGRIGAPGAEAPLAARLGDGNESVRAAVAFALGLLPGEAAATTVEALERALDDPSAEVRGRAAEALARRAGPAAAGTIAAAAARWAEPLGGPVDWGEDIARSEPRMPHPDLRGAFYALAELGAAQETVGLLTTERWTPRFVWWPAAWTAARLADDAMRPLLVHYAASPEPYLRLLAARGLGGLAGDDVRAALLRLVEDGDEKVRIEAFRSAARVGLVAAVPRLLEAMAGDTAYARLEAVRALAHIRDPRTVEPLIDLVSDERPWMRTAALEALAVQDPETFWLLLAGLGDDPDWRARTDLARLLARLHDPRARARLRALVDDRDFRVRAVALERFAAAAGPDSTGVLLDHLDAEDPFERAAAARALGRLRPDGGLAPLLDAWAPARGDAPELRYALLEAIAAYGAEAVEPLAREALDDPSWLVRRKARDVLLAAGLDVGVVVEGPGSDWTLYDYLDLVNPRYTPQAFVRTEKGPIEVELFVIDAPVAVAHFIRLAREEFYDGLTFHRVEPNGVVEGGDPRGDGHGGPGFHVRSEPSLRPVLRGTVGLVEPVADGAGSQFWIAHLPRPELRGRRTVIGQVTSGMEVVDRLVPGDLIREIVIWDGVRLGELAPPRDGRR